MKVIPSIKGDFGEKQWCVSANDIKTTGGCNNSFKKHIKKNKNYKLNTIKTDLWGFMILFSVLQGNILKNVTH